MLWKAAEDKFDTPTPSFQRTQYGCIWLVKVMPERERMYHNQHAWTWFRLVCDVAGHRGWWWHGMIIMCHLHVAGTYLLSTIIQSEIRRRNSMTEDGVVLWWPSSYCAQLDRAKYDPLVSDVLRIYHHRMGPSMDYSIRILDILTLTNVKFAMPHVYGKQLTNMTGHLGILGPLWPLKLWSDCLILLHFAWHLSITNLHTVSVIHSILYKS